MKKTRLISFAVVASMAISLFAGCSSKKEDPVVMTIDGYEVLASEYAYTLNRAYMDLTSMYSSYSETEFDGVENFELLQSYSLSTLQELYAIKKLIDDNSITATSEDNETLKSMIDETIEQLGGKQSYKSALRNIGVTAEYFENDNLTILLFQKLIADVYGNGQKSDEELYSIYENEYMHAQHILISTQDIASHSDDDGHEHEEGFVETSLEEAKAKADEVFAKAKAGEDFNALMATYNEDSGQPTAGYAFTEGYMVEEFENAVKSLNVGEFALIETDYGYHIIKKIAPNQENFDANRDYVEVGDGEMLASDAAYALVDAQVIEYTDIYDAITFENYADYLITE